MTLPARLLLADDEETFRNSVAVLLRREGYVCDVASTAEEAIERLNANTYDLLITDLRMPGLDGLAVIREAKHYRADLPVIIVTGFSSEASAIEAVNLGVAGYLTTPFRVPQVLAAAAKALGAPAA